MRSSSTRRGLGTAMLATLLLLVLSSAPAFAGGKSGATATKTDRPAEVADDDDSEVPDPNGDADNAHPSGNDRHEDKGTQGFSSSDPDDDGRGPDRGTDGADKPFADEDGTGGVDLGDQDGNNGCGNDDDFEDDNEGWCGHKPKPSTPEQPPAVGGTGGTKPPKPCTEDSTMPSGSEKDCDTDDTDVDDDAEVDDDGETTCPKAGELPAGSTMPAGCGGTPTVVSGTTDTTCPKAGDAPTGGTMPAGCLTTADGGTPVSGTTLTEGAVLASHLDATPAAPAGVETQVLGIQLNREAAAGGAAPAGASVLGSTVVQAAALARTGANLTLVLGTIALALIGLGFALRRFGRTEA